MFKNKIKTIKIIDIKEECKDVKTFTLDTTSFPVNSIETPKPGQFVMIWVPGEDEIPMSISGIDDQGNWQITVKKVGECTERLFNQDEDIFLGVRV
jgi:dihydroorotate dehydrogenase electron transfer subunit